MQIGRINKRCSKSSRHDRSKCSLTCLQQYRHHDIYLSKLKILCKSCLNTKVRQRDVYLEIKSQFFRRLPTATLPHTYSLALGLCLGGLLISTVDLCFGSTEHQQDNTNPIYPHLPYLDHTQCSMYTQRKKLKRKKNKNK